MWWNYMAESVLKEGRMIILVRYHELTADPASVVSRILDGLPAGTLREPVAPSLVRSKRSELDEDDEQAIRAICSQSAAELGLSDSEAIAAAATP
jgi:hypothetical protein